MTPKKLRFSHKLALAMMVLLAITLLFSSTFRGLVHPRVAVAQVGPGSIELVYSQHDIRIDPDCLVHGALPLPASEAVPVQEVLKTPGMQVYLGEALYILDKEAAESAYFAAKQAYTSALLALDDFDAGYDAAVQAAKEALDDAERTLARLQFAPEERLAAAEQAFQRAQSTYDRLAVDGIFQHTTRDVLENALLQASQRYEAWADLRKQDYRVLAAARGTIISMNSSFPCEYAILPSGKEVTLSITAPGIDFEGISAGQEAMLGDLSEREKAQSIAVSEVRYDGWRKTLVFQFVPETPGNLCVGNSYSIFFNSYRYSSLIPASALVNDNMIWIAEPVQNGSKTSYVAASKTIDRATGNAQFIPSTDWLNDALVITQWDKPLSYGQTVLILEDAP